MGKSSLVTRFAEGYYRDSSRPPTIAATFVSKTIPTSHGVSTKVQIWDTAGQERFRNIVSSYYRGVHGVVIMYDVTNRESFDNIPMWYSEVLKYAKENNITIIFSSFYIFIC